MSNPNRNFGLLDEYFKALKKKPRLTEEEIGALPHMKYKGNKDEKCTICFEPILRDSAIIILSCVHLFHEDCLQNWLRKGVTCPNCNLNLKYT
jgi:hypothetical protein